MDQPVGQTLGHRNLPRGGGYGLHPGGAAAEFMRLPPPSEDDLLGKANSPVTCGRPGLAEHASFWLHMFAPAQNECAEGTEATKTDEEERPTHSRRGPEGSRHGRRGGSCRTRARESSLAPEVSPWLRSSGTQRRAPPFEYLTMGDSGCRSEKRRPRKGAWPMAAPSTVNAAGVFSSTTGGVPSGEAILRMETAS
jgi:hypothetical protein